ncbi:MAG TPA: hypothetical protein VEF35_06755 [Candidatus Bathyarchaeia archaeon]|nr:hypothetical protein [Candidatus Bathyarchaeia archaeon]
MDANLKAAAPRDTPVVFLDLVGIGVIIPVAPTLLAGPCSPFYLLPAGYTIQT